LLEFETCETLSSPSQMVIFKEQAIIRLVIEGSNFVAAIQNIASFSKSLIGVYRTSTKRKDAFSFEENHGITLLNKVIDLIF
jgi:hypothetical protein